jgi:hypothetical protein
MGLTHIARCVITFIDNTFAIVVHNNVAAIVVLRCHVNTAPRRPSSLEVLMRILYLLLFMMLHHLVLFKS